MPKHPTYPVDKKLWEDYVRTLFSENGDYRFPFEDFVCSISLPRFLREARHSIRSIFKYGPYGKKDEHNPNQNFHLLAHGEVYDKNLLTGWQGNMLNLTDEKPKKFNGEVLKKQRKEAGSLEDKIVICSDLPRAIHHALLLKDCAQGLDSIALELRAAYSKKDKTRITSIRKELINLALDKNIIITPFARAQYYGPLEMRPTDQEELEKSLKSQIITRPDCINGPVQEHVLYLLKLQNMADNSLEDRLKETRNNALKADPEEVNDEEFINSMTRFAEHRTQEDCTFFFNDLVITESRLDMYRRAHILFNVLRRSKYQDFVIITSSGFLDTALAYFRKINDEASLVIENLKMRKKSSERGDFYNFEVKNGKFCDTIKFYEGLGRGLKYAGIAAALTTIIAALGTAYSYYMPCYRENLKLEAVFTGNDFPRVKLREAFRLIERNEYSCIDKKLFTDSQIEMLHESFLRQKNFAGAEKIQEGDTLAIRPDRYMQTGRVFEAEEEAKPYYCMHKDVSYRLLFNYENIVGVPIYLEKGDYEFTTKAILHRWFFENDPYKVIANDPLTKAPANVVIQVGRQIFRKQVDALDTAYKIPGKEDYLNLEPESGPDELKYTVNIPKDGCYLLTIRNELPEDQKGELFNKDMLIGPTIIRKLSK